MSCRNYTSQKRPATVLRRGRTCSFVDNDWLLSPLIADELDFYQCSYAVQTLVIVEPEATFTERRACVQEDMFAFTQADAHILALLQGGPMRLMTVLNITTRRMPARSKRQRKAVKHQILIRLGSLIRRGQLRRIRRKFVSLPAGCL